MYNIRGVNNLSNFKGNIFFTSDTLFFDEECFIDGVRYYNDVDEMNDDLILKWNRKVKRGDTIFHLGNFCCGGIEDTEFILSKLNGKINLIVGNWDTHDNILHFRQQLCSVSYKLEIFVDDVAITLNHFPQLNWNRKERGAWHLHGHERHQQPPLFERIIDVGVDGWDGNPLSFDEIGEIFEKRLTIKYFNKDEFNRF